MADTSSNKLLHVALSDEGAPVSQHSVLVDHGVQQLSIGPLIHHLVLEISNIDCFKEHWSDPGLKQEPASKIDSSDYSISTSLNIVFVPSVISIYFLLYQFVFLLKILVVSDNKKLYILSIALF